ncbi:hypothetical protein B9J07_27800 [Sinorhizobium sp. LM21]|uniref:hypothetical protein n=1 Tax=Sinorhizobium sp. LM21 TaxID=1449788 RepID=UPI0005D7A14A|nr:hypothetical protein [Sinorhizobium sp. LM21]AJW30202.1 hypothetical protein pLM21S1_p82 [Sinorhizobium sp. LM21]OWZ90394.1 hypothetical protein B9J07_27800 [Sinorhizobium sp. LM21]
MLERIKSLKGLLAACAAMQCTFVCFYDDQDETDYIGADPDEALEALEACDVMNLVVLDVAGARMGWVLIVTERGQDPEEQMADYTATGRINFLLSDPEFA